VISSANLNLSKIYEITGDSVASYRHFKEYIAYRDSVMDIPTVEKMADMRTDFEVSQKQLEVDLLNNQKRTQRIIMYSLGFFLLLSFIYYRRLSKEKGRSDLLLLNILPSRTAKELKEKGKVEARKFKAVTVMFTDFQAFTRHSQNLSPEKLVKSVDHFFSAFDKIIEKYGLEKIKTIGDAYMCTGGLISKGPMQPIKVIHAAFEILDFMKKERELDNDDIAHFDVRIGINTGPVVAGVVGTKKFAYDIWGDTVNVAARMETNSQAGMINISENTYQLVKDRFECEYRGEIDVKNKGMMKMYFVLRPQAILNNKETEAAEMEEISSAPHTP
jgi:class 3 adenylate cyclase